MNKIEPPVISEAEQIGEAANEFFAAISQGEEPSISQFAERYPKIADHIRRTFPALLLVGSCSTDENRSELLAQSDASKMLGDFRLIRELGRGGMGTVFEAEQVSMGRRVALKVLPFAALVHVNSLQRFRNEVRAAAALNHPHIVPVYSIGEERGVHFYAMQLIRGRTLADLIGDLRQECQGVAVVGLADSTHPTGDAEAEHSRETNHEHALISTAVDSRRGAESYRTAARLGIQAAEALQHAHDVGVLHRDIKPSNLMLGADGKIYVTDFGLARIEADAGLTMTGDIVGTLRYMAPEQALAKRVVIDHRADIYSLGATLYELLTLRLAFGETDRAELLKQIAFEEPQPLRKLDKHLPIELETIVLKAMAKNPGERYQAAQQLADDLRAYLEDRPIKAKPPTRQEQIVKWSRRHPAALWTAGLFVCGMAIVSVVSALLISNAYQREVTQRQIAETERTHAEDSFRKARSSINNLLFEPAVGDGIWSELSPVLRDRFAKNATTYYESLIQDDAINPTIRHETAVGYRSIASIRYRSKEYLQAETLFRQSIAILTELEREHPDNSEYRGGLAWDEFMLGATLVKLKRPDEAETILNASIEHYEKLIREGPANSDAVAEIYRAYEKLIEQRQRQGKSTAELLDRLLADVREAIRRAPDFAHNHSFLGLVLEKKGLLDEAVSAQREAVRLEPKNSMYRTNLGASLNDVGKNDGAISVLKEGIRIDPDDALLHNNLAAALEDKGQFADAAVEFQEAARLAPQLRIAWSGLGRCQYQAGNMNDAVDALMKAVARRGKNATEFFFLAMAEQKLDHKIEARDWFEKAVERQKKYPSADPELQQLHTEAEQVLGITEGRSSRIEKTKDEPRERQPSGD